jgi:hypothetical protein
VILSPGAVLMPWRDDVAAILAPFLPGESHGDAIADVLFGRGWIDYFSRYFAVKTRFS